MAVQGRMYATRLDEKFRRRCPDQISSCKINKIKGYGKQQQHHQGPDCASVQDINDRRDPFTSIEIFTGFCLQPQDFKQNGQSFGRQTERGTFETTDQI